MSARIQKSFFHGSRNGASGRPHREHRSRKGRRPLGKNQWEKIRLYKLRKERMGLLSDWPGI